MLGGASRACPRHVSGWFISRPAATVLNCISFPSLGDTGLFLRRASSCSWQVAEPTATSACLAPDVGMYFFLEMATISYSLCLFTPQVSFKLQLHCVEMGIGSRWLQRCLPLTTTEYFGTCFLIFITFSTSGRIVALVTADISMAPLCTKVSRKLCRECPAAPGAAVISSSSAAPDCVQSALQGGRGWAE